ncbi:MAG TPA: hypothetical protein VGO11_10340, partial [Chthoniobacteraceae bacterium]|nr:hypothetical protein [Chthoniobacteraceae bacterium]
RARGGLSGLFHTVAFGWLSSIHRNREQDANAGPQNHEKNRDPDHLAGIGFPLNEANDPEDARDAGTEHAEDPIASGQVGLTALRQRAGESAATIHAEFGRIGIGGSAMGAGFHLGGRYRSAEIPSEKKLQKR